MDDDPELQAVLSQIEQLHHPTWASLIRKKLHWYQERSAIQDKNVGLLFRLASELGGDPERGHRR